jgi:hypothetical protein
MLFLTKSVRFSLFFGGLLHISACTPSLNWRDVSLESSNGSTLKATLPCKPDHATRKQQLGDIQVELSMMGCVADQATFTLSRISLNDPLTVPQVLAAWEAAAVKNLNAKAPMPSSMGLKPSGFWPPPNKRITLVGTTMQAEIAWYIKQTPTGLSLYQAAMYFNASAKQADTEAATTFFESLQLQ